jgi:hypothetical protein
MSSEDPMAYLSGEASMSNLDLLNPRIKATLDQVLPCPWETLLVKLKKCIFPLLSQVGFLNTEIENFLLTIFHKDLFKMRRSRPQTLEECKQLSTDDLVCIDESTFQCIFKVSLSKEQEERHFMYYVCAEDVIRWIAKMNYQHDVDIVKQEIENLKRTNSCHVIDPIRYMQQNSSKAMHNTPMEDYFEQMTTKVTKLKILEEHGYKRYYDECTVKHLSFPFASPFCYWNPLAQDKILCNRPLKSIPFYVLLCARVNYAILLMRLVSESIQNYQPRMSSKFHAKDTPATETQSTQNQQAHKDAVISTDNFRTEQQEQQQEPLDSKYYFGLSSPLHQTSQKEAFDMGSTITNNPLLDHHLHYTPNSDVPKGITSQRYVYYTTYRRLCSFVKHHTKICIPVEVMCKPEQGSSMLSIQQVRDVLRVLKSPSALDAYVKDLEYCFYADDANRVKEQYTYHVGPSNAQIVQAIAARLVNEKDTIHNSGSCRFFSGNRMCSMNGDQVLFDPDTRVSAVFARLFNTHDSTDLVSALNQGQIDTIFDLLNENHDDCNHDEHDHQQQNSVTISSTYTPVPLKNNITIVHTQCTMQPETIEGIQKPKRGKKTKDTRASKRDANGEQTDHENARPIDTDWIERDKKDYYSRVSASSFAQRCLYRTFDVHQLSLMNRILKQDSTEKDRITSFLFRSITNVGVLLCDFDSAVDYISNIMQDCTERRCVQEFKKALFYALAHFVPLPKAQRNAQQKPDFSCFDKSDEETCDYLLSLVGNVTFLPKDHPIRHAIDEAKRTKNPVHLQWIHSSLLLEPDSSPALGKISKCVCYYTCLLRMNIAIQLNKTLSVVLSAEIEHRKFEEQSLRDKYTDEQFVILERVKRDKRNSKRRGGANNNNNTASTTTTTTTSPRHNKSKNDETETRQDANAQLHEQEAPDFEFVDYEPKYNEDYLFNHDDSIFTKGPYIHKNDDMVHVLREIKYQVHSVFLDHIPMMTYMIANGHFEDAVILNYELGAHYECIKPVNNRFLTSDNLPDASQVICKLITSIFIKIKPGVDTLEYLLNKLASNCCQVRGASAKLADYYKKSEQNSVLVDAMVECFVFAGYRHNDQTIVYKDVPLLLNMYRNLYVDSEPKQNPSRLEEEEEEEGAALKNAHDKQADPEEEEEDCAANKSKARRNKRKKKKNQDKKEDKDSNTKKRKSKKDSTESSYFKWEYGDSCRAYRRALFLRISENQHALKVILKEFFVHSVVCSSVIETVLDKSIWYAEHVGDWRKFKSSTFYNGNLMREFFVTFATFPGAPDPPQDLVLVSPVDRDMYCRFVWSKLDVLQERTTDAPNTTDKNRLRFKETKKGKRVDLFWKIFLERKEEDLQAQRDFCFVYRQLLEKSSHLYSLVLSRPFKDQNNQVIGDAIIISTRLVLVELFSNWEMISDQQKRCKKAVCDWLPFHVTYNSTDEYKALEYYLVALHFSRFITEHKKSALGSALTSKTFVNRYVKNFTKAITQRLAGKSACENAFNPPTPIQVDTNQIQEAIKMKREGYRHPHHIACTVPSMGVALQDETKSDDREALIRTGNGTTYGSDESFANYIFGHRLGVSVSEYYTEPSVVDTRNAHNAMGERKTKKERKKKTTAWIPDGIYKVHPRFGTDLFKWWLGELYIHKYAEECADALRPHMLKGNVTASVLESIQYEPSYHSSSNLMLKKPSLQIQSKIKGYALLGYLTYSFTDYFIPVIKWLHEECGLSARGVECMCTAMKEYVRRRAPRRIANSLARMDEWDYALVMHYIKQDQRRNFLWYTRMPIHTCVETLRAVQIKHQVYVNSHCISVDMYSPGDSSRYYTSAYTECCHRITTFSNGFGHYEVCDETPFEVYMDPRFSPLVHDNRRLRTDKLFSQQEIRKYKLGEYVTFKPDLHCIMIPSVLRSCSQAHSYLIRSGIHRPRNNDASVSGHHYQQQYQQQQQQHGYGSHPTESDKIIQKSLKKTIFSINRQNLMAGPDTTLEADMIQDQDTQDPLSPHQDKDAQQQDNQDEDMDLVDEYVMEEEEEEEEQQQQQQQEEQEHGKKRRQEQRRRKEQLMSNDPNAILDAAAADLTGADEEDEEMSAVQKRNALHDRNDDDDEGDQDDNDDRVNNELDNQDLSRQDALQARSPTLNSSSTIGTKKTAVSTRHHELLPSLHGQQTSSTTSEVMSLYRRMVQDSSLPMKDALVPFSVPVSVQPQGSILVNMDVIPLTASNTTDKHAKTRQEERQDKGNQGNSSKKTKKSKAPYLKIEKDILKAFMRQGRHYYRLWDPNPCTDPSKNRVVQFNAFGSVVHSWTNSGEIISYVFCPKCGNFSTHSHELWASSGYMCSRCTLLYPERALFVYNEANREFTIVNYKKAAAIQNPETSATDPKKTASYRKNEHGSNQSSRKEVKDVLAQISKGQDTIQVPNGQTIVNQFVNVTRSTVAPSIAPIDIQPIPHARQQRDLRKNDPACIGNENDDRHAFLIHRTQAEAAWAQDQDDSDKEDPMDIVADEDDDDNPKHGTHKQSQEQQQQQQQQQEALFSDQETMPSCINAANDQDCTNDEAKQTHSHNKAENDQAPISTTMENRDIHNRVMRLVSYLKSIEEPADASKQVQATPGYNSIASNSEKSIELLACLKYTGHRIRSHFASHIVALDDSDKKGPTKMVYLSVPKKSVTESSWFQNRQQTTMCRYKQSLDLKTTTQIKKR